MRCLPVPACPVRPDALQVLALPVRPDALKVLALPVCPGDPMPQWMRLKR
jgi:hypothetical protein